MGEECISVGGIVRIEKLVGGTVGKDRERAIVMEL